jgi:hypothetical protein
MSDKLAVQTTTVIGYFNPQKYSIQIEISEVNLKTELAPGAYVRDRSGRYINDPVFEPYCHTKGLARATGNRPLPILYVPRFVKPERPVTAVTQATGFVRQGDGRTVPTYSKPQEAPKETAVNKKPYLGMTVEQARKAGYLGRQVRLVPEDFGAEETTGKPPEGTLPNIAYSLESPPKIKSTNVLPPELTEADEKLSPQEQAQRSQLQTSLAQASAQSPENFNPARLRATHVPPTNVPAVQVQPVTIAPQPVAKPRGRPRLTPTIQPVQTSPVVSVTPFEEANQTGPAVRVASPVELEAPVEVQEAPAQEPMEEAAGSGIVEPLHESNSAPSVPEAPPVTDSGKRFVCAADGKAFPYRSELERYVKRKYPEMAEEFMKPYPAP